MATPLLLQRHFKAACTLCFISLFGHAQDVLWEKSFGGKHADYLTDIVATADYGFLLGGSSVSSNTGNKKTGNEGDLDYWIWKMDETGEMEWQKSFGGSGNDFLQCVNLTRDGGFFLAGHSDSDKGKQKLHNSKGNHDFWIVKLDAGGGEQWQKTVGGPGNEKLISSFQTKDGGYILGGTSDSGKGGDKTTKNQGGNDYWIVKLDGDGAIEWQKCYGGKYFEELRSIEQTRDGGYIVGGYSNSPASGDKTEDRIGAGDYWVLRLDSKGDIIWQKVIGGDKDDQLCVVHQTFDGGYILGGNSNSQSSYLKSKGNVNGTDFWVVKLKEDGEMSWQETYDFGTFDFLASIIENKDKTLLIGGYAKSEMDTENDERGINDYIAIKINSEGTLLWQKSIGSNGDDALKKVIETRDGSYILAGTSTPFRQMNAAKSKKPNGKSKISQLSIGSGEQAQMLQNATDKLNNAVGDAVGGINDKINEATGQVTDGINDALDTGDSAFKMGVNQPTNLIGGGPTLGGGSGGDMLDKLGENLSSPKTSHPPSGDKMMNYGGLDFWVVKLKDKGKTALERKTSLEAMPNPTDAYTNIIINYDFQSGTVTVADLSGHVLETIPINSRTVPVNLSNYPEGVYIINIKTENGNEGIKVIKKK